ncbi:MAG: ArsR/SmtB family transcription factor, partial [Ilumatobacteraceae bacterium]
MDDSRIVQQFQALGDPVRWVVLSALRVRTRCAHELADAAGVSPTLMSHHLKVLREAGLIAAAKRGRYID